MQNIIIKIKIKKLLNNKIITQKYKNLKYYKINAILQSRDINPRLYKKM